MYDVDAIDSMYWGWIYPNGSMTGQIRLIGEGIADLSIGHNFCGYFPDRRVSCSKYVCSMYIM